MAISKARDIATSIGKAVKADTITSAGLVPSSAAAFSVYDSTTDLPTSGIAVGSQGYVSSNQRLYIRGDGGWYNIATVNNTPSINSVQTAGGDSSPFELATDGATTTVITITATDSEGFPITFSAVTDVGFDSIATVSQDSSVFTITPFSEDSAGIATSGTLTFKATDGVNIASEVATFTITFNVAKSNFTSMLLKASGNNGTNTTINDASSNTHSISVNGNAAAQAFTPYHPGGYSVHQINTEQLTFAQHSDFNFGSGDFTIEYWIWPDGTPNDQTSMPDMRPPSTNGNYIQVNINSSNQVGLYAAASQRISQNANTALKSREWNHVALVRSGSTTTLYIDGLSRGTWSDSTTYAEGRCVINGHSYQSNRGWTSGCYLRDFRIVKGTAVYTGNFTPPTGPLTTTGGTYPDNTNRTDPAASATSLLTCHLPHIYDGSSSNHSVTKSGTPEVERFGPYDYVNYSASSHAASVYFDGSGDFLEISDDASLEFGNGDFTVEFWYRGTDTDQYATLTTKGAITAGATGTWIIIMNQYVTGDISVYVADYTTGAPMLNTGGVGASDGNWHHIAFVRNGTSFKLYVDGVSKANQTSSLTFGNSSNSVFIGKDPVYPRDCSGFISDYRIVKGTAVYTSNFTPPTAPLTAISGTSLLTCNDTPNVFNSTGVHTLPVKLFGDAKSSTSQNKNASSAMFFDGSGDYITSEFPALGTDDFTIEFWIRPDTINSNFKALMDTRTSNANNPLVWIRNNNVLYLYSASGERIVGTTTLSTSTWYHVALVRNNGVSQLFLNGVQEGSDYVDTNPYTESTLFLGQRYTGTAYNYNGYMEDFRITKGLGRYPFIPTKETLTAISGTDLLVAHAATITDGSSNSIAVTANGDAAVSSFAPKSGMYSVAFDGAGDYLKTASSSNLNLYNTNFTIEGWFYATAPAGNEHIWSSYIDQSNRESIYFTDSTTLKWWVNGSNRITATVAANTWHHVAIVENSGTTTMFIDGARRGTWSSTYTDGNRLVWIGTYNDGGVASDSFTGYISNVRLLRGTALYTNSFTPPTLELKG